MYFGFDFGFEISIHAPARGATRGYRQSGKKAYDFNPRSREGSDQENSQDCRNRAISIHAPARGATIVVPPSLKNVCNFNPRSREGSD